MVITQGAGIGTYRLNKETAYTMVKRALDLGYRHIDTAKLYKNEESVGRAIRDSGVPRNDIFLTTKIDMMDIRKLKIIEATERSLSLLGTHIDLLLLHKVTDNYVEAWNLLNETHKLMGDRIKNIGVSNFRENELASLDPLPKYNQIELSPFLTRESLVEFCREQDIHVIAHSSLAKGEKFDNPTLNEIAEKYSATPAQIMLSWGYQKNYTIIPRTSCEHHLKENMKIIEITNDDINILDSLDCGYSTHPKLL